MSKNTTERNVQKLREYLIKTTGKDPIKLLQNNSINNSSCSAHTKRKSGPARV